MQELLNIALIQSNLVWENPKQNRINFTEKIDGIQKHVDLIVLPEMFSTGFSMNAIEIAETMEGETIKWMQAIAHQKDVAITGSLVVNENDSYFNRSVFVHPSGKIETYDKRHTFTLAKEHLTYTAGNKHLIVNYKGWKLCMLICYDLRFPVWARNTSNYDALVYVANWPKVRIDAWDSLLKARAIENMSYCIGVNRVGLDANNHEYSGHSAAYDVLGKRLDNIPFNKEAIDIVTLQKSHLEAYRKKLGFLNDQDDFTLK